jgi:hypothetical protein
MTARDEDTAESLLHEALNLVVRARKLDTMQEEQAAREAFPKTAEEYGYVLTNSLTPHLWVQQQYEADLEEWEQRARAFLNPTTPGGRP